MDLSFGTMAHGKNDLITDVKGVRVGHFTIDRGDCHTGVTVILPSEKNPFNHKMTAASHVINGFGKTMGLIQLDELGTLETPIAITNTLNVGKVHDALVSYMLRLCDRDGITLTSVNPVVCECNDSRINDIRQRPIGEKEVFAAIGSASEIFEQGAVGAGRGTVCYGLKGGIGSSSRIFEIDGKEYTVGVLVQSNYGSARDLTLCDLTGESVSPDQGSIILIVATDLPLSSRQLKRVIKRVSVGMARLGSYIGHGSGEIVIGFTTCVPEKCGDSFLCQRIMREDLLDPPFRAAGECAEEAIVRSMLYAGRDRTLQGQEIRSLREYEIKKTTR